MSNIDLVTSRELAGRIEAKPQQCYYNAFIGLQAVGRGEYVEGYVVTLNDLVIEHGWIELDGRIIDPTLCDGR